MVDAWTGANGPIGTGLFSVWREMMSMEFVSVEMTKPAWTDEFGDLGGNSSACSKWRIAGIVVSLTEGNTSLFSAE